MVLLVDHSKFGERASCQALSIKQIHEVITEAGAAAADVATLERRGVTVRVAPVDRSLAQEVLTDAP